MTYVLHYSEVLSGVDPMLPNLWVNVGANHCLMKDEHQFSNVDFSGVQNSSLISKNEKKLSAMFCITKLKMLLANL